MIEETPAASPAAGNQEVEQAIEQAQETPNAEAPAEPLRIVVPAGGLEFVDPDGRPLLTLSRYQDALSLSLHAPEGLGGVTLFVSPAGAMIKATTDGFTGVFLHAAAHGGSVDVADPDGTTVASLSAHPGGGRLAVTDSAGGWGWDLNASLPAQEEEPAEDPALASLMIPRPGEIVH